MVDFKKSLPYIVLLGIIGLVAEHFNSTNSNFYYQMPTDPRFVFFPIIIFTMMTFVINIIIAIWVYNDAQKRGDEAVVWLLIVLFTNFIGLIIYLVVRGERKPRYNQYEQSYTGQSYGGTQTQQSFQNYNQSSSTIFCIKCGAENTRASNFCNNCGAKLPK